MDLYVLLVFLLLFWNRKTIKEWFLARQKKQLPITERTLPDQEPTVSVVSVGPGIDCYIKHHWPKEDPNDVEKLTNDLAWKFFEKAFRQFNSDKRPHEELSEKELAVLNECYEKVSTGDPLYEAPSWLTAYDKLWPEWKKAGLLD